MTDLFAAIKDAGALQVLACVGAVALLIYSLAKTGGKKDDKGGSGSSSGGAT